MSFDPGEHPHRRFNPLTGDWVLVSPHRARRPWLGEEEAPEVAAQPSFDPGCYLCPGNRRAAGAVNPSYTGVHVFDNDFPALLPDAPGPENADAILRAEAARGTCRVLCFSPDHALTLPELSLSAVSEAVTCWKEETERLSTQFAYVQVFENKGAMMGCSNPHPHSQIWATSFVPTEVETEDRLQRAYFERHGADLLGAVIDRERALKARVIFETGRFLAIVPHWAAWPFETLLVAKRPIARLADLDEEGIRDLASALKRLTARYDNLFGCSFPYSMGVHGAPARANAKHWRLHLHFYPPLLRSATIRKFMVGFEILAEAQRDLTPEAAAERLRAASETHYRNARS